jgi:gliding motility-associated-like protein
MKIRFPKSNFKNIFILLFLLLSHTFYAQQYSTLGNFAKSTGVHAKLHSQLKWLSQSNLDLDADRLGSNVYTMNFDSIWIVSKAKFSSDASGIADNTSIFKFTNASGGIFKNYSLSNLEALSVNNANISADRFILSTYTDLFEKRLTLAVPPASITGNFNVCFPTPGTSQLTGSGVAAVINPWTSSNPASATVNSTGLVTGIALGATTITYTDIIGNNASQTIFVVPLPTISGTLVKCAGGTTQLTGSGTAAGLNPWVSQQPGIATVSNTGLVTGVSGGSATIVYTNSNGCSAQATVTINPLLLPTITCGAATTTQVTFNWGAVAGAATYTVSYNINGSGLVFIGNIGPVLTYTKGGLNPNDSVVITVTPSGAVGTCFASGSQTCLAATCTAAMLPAAPIVAVTQPTCTVATGDISVTGVAGETYSLDLGPYSGTLVYPGLASGAHTITAKNANACTAVTNVTINPQPGTPAPPTLTPTHPTCTLATGTITITAVAGETYSLDLGPYSATLIYAGLAAGPHSVIAKNAAGCISAAANVTLNPQPAIPAAPTVAVTQPTCTVATGDISITSVAADTYSFDLGPYSATLIYAGISPGPHSVTVKNPAGCTAITNFTINPQPATSAAPTLTPTHPTCTLATGTITITAVAGETYSLDLGAYSATLVYAGLAAGPHSITAKNAAGCISPATNVTLNPQPGTPAAPTLTPTHSTCSLATGTITITAVAGETYSLDLGAYSATLVYAGLAAGPHSVTAKNAAGCISPATNVTLNPQPGTPAAPTLTPTHPTCSLATGTITITAVAGETYSLDLGPYSGTLVYAGLAAGPHSVTAKNAAGCISAAANVTLNPQPGTPAAPTLAPTHPTCSLATGTITITAVAGETYSLDLGAYSPTLVYAGLAAGPHSVTAKNAAGCISPAANVTLNPQPGTPAAPTLTPTHPTCSLSTGTITITAVAGETYSLDLGAYSATLVYAGLAAGPHSVTAKNAAGCISAAANVTLNPQPGTPAAPTLTPTHPTCTLATGTITITAVAGETYSLDLGPYSATLVYAGLAAGPHSVTAKNAAGCISAAANVTLNPQPGTPAAPTLTPTHPTCSLATGTITITAVAGETYSLDLGAYSATLVYAGLAAGPHSVTAKNAAGCISPVANVTLNPQPGTPAAPTLIPTHPTCSLATGTITITAVAGETYSLDLGAYSPTLVYAGLAAGPHSVTAKNAAGCISVAANVTLNLQPGTPAAPTLTPTHATCTLATGTITITAVAGETYSLDLGAYSATLVYAGLAAGPHSVTAKNAAGCISPATNVTLNPQPGTPAAPTLTPTHATCSLATGTITITAVVGETYSLDLGAYSPTLVYAGLAAGPHSVTAKNAAGCISAATIITLDPQPGTPAAPTLTPTHPTCILSTGTITITAVAGETYSLDLGPYSATLVYAGLAAGPHSVTAKNAAGCISAAANVTLNPQPGTPAAPTLTPTHPTCSLATGTITITAVAGETYSLDLGAYSPTLVYAGLATGPHSVTAKNAAGCISGATIITINPQPGTPSAPTLTPTHPTCSLSTGTITITAVAGETYSLDLGPYSATLIYAGLAAGPHSVTAKNAAGCISPAANVTLNPQPGTPAAPTLTPTHPTCSLATGTITITAVAGETYSLDLGPYSATLVYAGLVAGPHSVTAKNAAGCISGATIITINPQPGTPAAPTLTPTHPTCTLATGTITITAVTGETYSLDLGPYSAILIYAGLAAGPHSVIAKNAAGCISAAANVTLNPQPAIPAAPTVAVTQPTCTVATGDISITSVAADTYSFDLGPYSATLIYAGISPGPHSVTVKNPAGCTAITNFTINPQPATPAAPTLTPTHPTCTLATGTITITAVAGETYSLDLGPYSATLVYAGLAAGPHSVTAKNAAGCISPAANVTLNPQPGTPAAPTLTPTHPTCSLATGTITITPVAGETYSLDLGVYSATLVYAGLAAGPHSVTAKNAAGCISPAANVTLNPQPGTPAAPTLTPTHPTCSLATGTITITAVAGETYSLDLGAYSATLVYAGLAAGPHSVTAKNAAGCISAAANVTLNPQPGTPSAPMLTPTHPTCSLATGTITITAVAGETYSLDLGAYSATLVYAGLAAGPHSVTAKNAAGCISPAANVTLNPPPGTPAAPTLTPTHPTCSLATGTITITAVAGETYSLDLGAYSATLVYAGLAAGPHSVTAKNAAGCISAAANVTLNPQPGTPSAPMLTPTHPTCSLATGTITITAVAGETYSLDLGAYSATLVYAGLAAGPHSVTAKNAAGCISPATNVTLNPQPGTPAAPTLTLTHPTCILSTGTITITAVAGETYSLDLGAYSATLVYAGLATGPHSVTAKNAAGCISPATNVTLNPQPGTPAAPTLIPTHPTCSLATGTITITAVAGETYSLDLGAYSATLVYAGLAAGPHSVTAKNAAGCISAAANVTLNPQPGTPAAPTLTPTHPTCTIATGTITITAVAGETYSLDLGLYSATLVYAGLAAGPHSVTAKNAGGCISAATIITLNPQPGTPAAPTLTPTHATCTLATGTITITAVAGETYSLDLGAYSATLVYAGLAAGPHSVTAKNAAGCISVAANVTLNPQPGTPAAPTLTPTHPTCSLSTGTITITAVAGETYSLDLGPYSPTLVYAGLAAGPHSVTAKNAAGCISAAANVTLNPQPGTPAAPTLTPTHPTCTIATGTITITAVAGETYSLDLGLYSATLVYAGLAAGPHSVTAKNAAGCISAATIITLDPQPGTPAAPTLTPTHPTCILSTGTITITAVGGETYSLDLGAYSATLVYAGLAAGPHSVTAKNAAGCISPAANVTLNPQPGTPAAPTLTPTHPTCSLATGTITITAVAGETYSLDLGPYSATLVYAGLLAGPHSVTAKNAAGCISGATIITINPQPGTPMVTATPALQSICTQSSTNVALSSNIAGTTYNWTVVQNEVTGATDGSGNTINQLLETTGTSKGTVIYIVTPTNSNGCIGNPINITITVNPLPAPVLSDGIICVDQATGTTIKSYTLNTGLNNSTHDFEWYLNGNSIAGTESTFVADLAGVYTVIATNNATGCVSMPVSATITESYAGKNIVAISSQAFSDNPMITVNVSPANPEYLYQLDGGKFQSSNVFNPVTPGLHTIVVNDANGCTNLTAEVLIIDYPRYFTPNGDGIHDFWNILGLSNQPAAKIYIFDRYGKFIQQISPLGAGWDGTSNSYELPGTDYWFTVEYLENQQQRVFKSHFALKR